MTERDAFLRAILSHPNEDTPRLVFADWLDDHEEPEKAAALRAGKIIVDNDTYFAIRDLSACRFSPGSWDKRFARDMRDRAIDGTPPPQLTITVRQWVWVWRTAWRYRRQVAQRTIRRCKELGIDKVAAAATG